MANGEALQTHGRLMAKTARALHGHQGIRNICSGGAWQAPGSSQRGHAGTTRTPRKAKQILRGEARQAPGSSQRGQTSTTRTPRNAKHLLQGKPGRSLGAHSGDGQALHGHQGMRNICSRGSQAGPREHTAEPAQALNGHQGMRNIYPGGGSAGPWKLTAEPAQALHGHQGIRTGPAQALHGHHGMRNIRSESPPKQVGLVPAQIARHGDYFAQNGTSDRANGAGTTRTSRNAKHSLRIASKTSWVSARPDCAPWSLFCPKRHL
jgi:hypothetical protein